MVTPPDPALLSVQVCIGVSHRQVIETTLELAVGSTAADVLAAVSNSYASFQMEAFELSVWGRAVRSSQVLKPGDRVELTRALRVDPKVARRERFAQQGARSAGLFSKRRPGGKAGY